MTEEFPKQLAMAGVIIFLCVCPTCPFWSFYR